MSRVGTLAVADIEQAGERITCVSADAVWENGLHEPPHEKPEIFADAPPTG